MYEYVFHVVGLCQTACATATHNPQATTDEDKIHPALAPGRWSGTARSVILDTPNLRVNKGLIYSLACRTSYVVPDVGYTVYVYDHVSQGLKDASSPMKDAHIPEPDDPSWECGWWVGGVAVSPSCLPACLSSSCIVDRRDLTNYH